MRTFEGAAATSAANAVTLAELGLRESWIFRRMVTRGVFVPVGEGRWYMREAAAQDFRHGRFVRMVVFVVIGIIALLLTMTFSR